MSSLYISSLSHPQPTHLHRHSLLMSEAAAVIPALAAKIIIDSVLQCLKEGISWEHNPSDLCDMRTKPQLLGVYIPKPAHMALTKLLQWWSQWRHGGRVRCPASKCECLQKISVYLCLYTNVFSGCRLSIGPHGVKLFFLCFSTASFTLLF